MSVPSTQRDVLTMCLYHFSDVESDWGWSKQAGTHSIAHDSDNRNYRTLYSVNTQCTDETPIAQPVFM